MKKFWLMLGFISLFFACFMTDASAKDMSRRFGLGVDSSIGKYADDGRGISVVYSINKYFGMQLIFGVSTYNADVSIPDQEKRIETTITEWNVSIRGLIPIVLSADVNLAGVVGFTASGRASGGFKSTDEKYMKFKDGYNFSIDLGVRPEWFVSEHFSIHTQVGIAIAIITDDSSVTNVALPDNAKEMAQYSTEAKGTHVDFFKNADLLGMAGFTFWF